MLPVCSSASKTLALHIHPPFISSQVLHIHCAKYEWRVDVEARVMDTLKKVVGIVGSYRKDGFIDAAIAQILAAAQSQGAETQKIYLQD